MSRKKVPLKNSKIVCIGAFGNPKLDPSPVYLGSLVRSKNVTIVDRQDADLLAADLMSKVMEPESGKKSEKALEHLRRRIRILSSTISWGVLEA